MKRTKSTYLALLAVLLSPMAANAVLIIDNGVIDPTRTAWNDTDPSFTIFDDFVLTGDTTITGIEHGIFMPGIGNYVQTFVSIFDGIDPTASAIIAEFSVVGTLASNGLVTSNPNVPNGFDVLIDGLSLTLEPKPFEGPRRKSQYVCRHVLIKKRSKRAMTSRAMTRL